MSSAWHRLISGIRRILGRFEDERTEDGSRFDLVVQVEADEDDGGFVASMPDVPGCVGQGETVEEAMANVVDALHEIITESLIEQNISRAPQTAATRAPETFKVAVGF